MAVVQYELFFLTPSYIKVRFRGILISTDISYVLLLVLTSFMHICFLESSGNCQKSNNPMKTKNNHFSLKINFPHFFLIERCDVLKKDL